MWEKHRLNLRYRIETEIRNAKKSATISHKYTDKFSYSEKRMGQIGYETWNYAILENLGKLGTNAKQIRMRVEKMYIKRLQPKLNIKSNHRWVKVKSKVHS